jgi:hypothetical protein
MDCGSLLIWALIVAKASVLMKLAKLKASCFGIPLMRYYTARSPLPKAALRATLASSRPNPMPTSSLILALNS